MAARLRDAGVVALPEASALPDLGCRCRIALHDGSVRVAISLAVLATGQLWVLPWAVEDWRIELFADGERFRLHAGPYDTVDAARAAAVRLGTTLKLKPFVVMR